MPDKPPVTTNKPAVGIFEPTVRIFRSKVSTFKSEVRTFRSKVLTFKSKVSTFGSEVLTFKSKVLTFGSKVSTFRSKVSTFGPEVLAFGSEVLTFKSEVLTSRSKVSTFGSEVSTFGSKVSTFKSKAPTFGSKVSTFGSKVLTFKSKAPTFGSEVLTFKSSGIPSESKGIPFKSFVRTNGLYEMAGVHGGGDSGRLGGAGGGVYNPGEPRACGPGQVLGAAGRIGADGRAPVTLLAVLSSLCGGISLLVVLLRAVRGVRVAGGACGGSAGLVQKKEAAMQKRQGVFWGHIALCMAGIAIFTGCDLFGNKQEIDLEAAIDEKIKYANAPIIHVEVQENGTGTANPRGAVQNVKYEYPFRLVFNPYNDYGFLGWRASLDGEELARWERSPLSGQISETGGNKVLFKPENETGTEVHITSYVNPGNGKILIEPVGVDRTAVQGIDTGDSSYIQIRFTRPIAFSSIVWDKEEWDSDFDNYCLDPAWSKGGAARFRNIAIYSETYQTNIEQFFAPPCLSPDGLWLTLYPNVFTEDKYRSEYEDEYRLFEHAAGDFGQGIITVTLDRGITDTHGVPMGQKYSYALKKLDERPDHPELQKNVAVLPADFRGGSAPQSAFTSGIAFGLAGYKERHILPDSGGHTVYIVFQCHEMPKAPVVGVRLYEFSPNGGMYGSDVYCHYIGDFPLLRDRDPALARSLEERGGQLMALNPPFHMENPVYAVEAAIPARGSPRPPGIGGAYPMVTADHTETQRTLELRICPLSAFDTMNPLKDSDKVDTLINGPIGRTGFPIPFRYFK
jgi:hypothetical protein